MTNVAVQPKCFSPCARCRPFMGCFGITNIRIHSWDVWGILGPTTWSMPHLCLLLCFTWENQPRSVDFSQCSMAWGPWFSQEVGSGLGVAGLVIELKSRSAKNHHVKSWEIIFWTSHWNHNCGKHHQVGCSLLLDIPFHKHPAVAPKRRPTSSVWLMTAQPFGISLVHGKSHRNGWEKPGPMTKRTPPVDSQGHQGVPTRPPAPTAQP